MKDNNINEDNIGNIEKGNVLTEKINNNENNKYDEENNKGISLNNEHFENDTNDVLNSDDMNTKQQKKEDNEESYEKSKINSLSNKNNNIYYLKDNNYFIDTLFNYCKSNKDLHFAVQTILPNFSKRFLSNSLD